MARETEFSNYTSKVESDAGGFLDYRWDSIRQNAMDGDYSSRKSPMDDLSDGLFEHLNQEIDLHEAADILSECKNEETDSGMWEGCETPEQAVGYKAFYSFLNDVREEVKSQLETKLEELKEEQEKFLDEELQKVLDEQQAYLEQLEQLELGLEEAQETLSDNEDKATNDAIKILKDLIVQAENKIKEVTVRIEELEGKVSDQESVIDNIQSAIDNM